MFSPSPTPPPHSTLFSLPKTKNSTKVKIKTNKQKTNRNKSSKTNRNKKSTKKKTMEFNMLLLNSNRCAAGLRGLYNTVLTQLIQYIIAIYHTG